MDNNDFVEGDRPNMETIKPKINKCMDPKFLKDSRILGLKIDLSFRYLRH